MVKRDEYAEEVAQTFIRMIKEGTAPWRMKWEPGETFVPKNIASGKPYSGFNSLYLWALSEEMGWKDPRFMTYKQAQEMGGHVRKGEHGAKIIFFTDRKETAQRDEFGNIVKDPDGKAVMLREKLGYAVFRTYTVFNGEQVEGIEPYTQKELPTEQLWQNQGRAEDIMVGSGAIINHVEGGTENYYSPVTDSITLCAKPQFPTLIDYYSVAFHELSHWTGHENRLNRDLSNSFGSRAYAQEELRAELGQFMICQNLGLGYEPYELSQTAAYLESWVKVLNDKPQEIMAAAADAQKIMDYVMAFEPKNSQGHEIENRAVEMAETLTPEQVKVAHVMKAISPATGQTEPGPAATPTRPADQPQPQPGLGR